MERSKWRLGEVVGHYFDAKGDLTVIRRVQTPMEGERLFIKTSGLREVDGLLKRVRVDSYLKDIPKTYRP